MKIAFEWFRYDGEWLVWITDDVEWDDRLDICWPRYRDPIEAG